MERLKAEYTGEDFPGEVFPYGVFRHHTDRTEDSVSEEGLNMAAVLSYGSLLSYQSFFPAASLDANGPGTAATLLCSPR